MVRQMCEKWGYKPEEAIEAPLWVLRMSSMLGRYEQMKPKAD